MSTVVIDAARAVAIPLDREVIHILPQEFIVDDQVGIKKPLGMYGVRLEADVHIVTGAVTSAQNIVKSVNDSGLQVADIVLQQLASAEAVLTPDEKELGVALIDMGGGTTDLAIFVEGSIWHTAVLSLGGNNITNDIAMGLQTPTHDAEEIKKKFGCAMSGPDRSGGDHRGAIRWRAASTQAGASSSLRHHRAAGGGDFRPGES
jgi:cell division protein FtsA